MSDEKKFGEPSPQAMSALAETLNHRYNGENLFGLAQSCMMELEPANESHSEYRSDRFYVGLQAKYPYLDSYDVGPGIVCREAFDKLRRDGAPSLYLGEHSQSTNLNLLAESISGRLGVDNPNYRGNPKAEALLASVVNQIAGTYGQNPPVQSLAIPRNDGTTLELPLAEPVRYLNAYSSALWPALKCEGVSDQVCLDGIKIVEDLAGKIPYKCINEVRDAVFDNKVEAAIPIYVEAVAAVDAARGQFLEQRLPTAPDNNAPCVKPSPKPTPNR